MPEMMEIYKKHATNYDELVQAEDHLGNLDAFLQKKVSWKNALVYEAGIGTGRVTKIYLETAQRCYGFDRESHMLDVCKNNLKMYEDKLLLNKGDNLHLPNVAEPVDVFIEGWSFGHTILENQEHYQSVFKEIYTQLCSLVKIDGTLILMETMGTFVDQATVPHPMLTKFYQHLENDYHFTPHILSTDYLFPDYKEAARIMGFFFGAEMFDKIITAQQNIIPEYTGIWIKTKSGNDSD